MKLFDAELKLMHVLWREGDTTAVRLSEIMTELHGWKKTATYTFIKRLMAKDAVARIAPKFTCRALVTLEQARAYETAELVEKMYGGATDLLITALVSGKLPQDEVARLERLLQVPEQ